MGTPYGAGPLSNLAERTSLIHMPGLQNSERGPEVNGLRRLFAEFTTLTQAQISDSKVA